MCGGRRRWKVLLSGGVWGVLPGGCWELERPGVAPFVGDKWGGKGCHSDGDVGVLPVGCLEAYRLGVAPLMGNQWGGRVVIPKGMAVCFLLDAWRRNAVGWHL